MANEDPTNTELEDETIDLGDELEGNDPDALALAAVEGGDDDGEEGKPANKPQTIPYDRFAEVNEKRKAAEDQAQREREERIRLEERLRAYEGAGKATEQPPPKTEAFDMKAKIKERNAAILEGDDDRVAEIEAEIEQHRIAEAEARAVARIEENNRLTALQQAAAEVVEAYPFLDSTAADADKEAISEVKEWRDFYIAQGKAPHTALRKAVDRLKPVLDAKLGQHAAPQKTAADIASEKRAASAVRNAKAATSQPPAPGGQSNGITPTTVDASKMTGDDWMKLPEKERERHLV